MLYKYQSQSPRRLPKETRRHVPLPLPRRQKASEFSWGRSSSVKIEDVDSKIHIMDLVQTEPRGKVYQNNSENSVELGLCMVIEPGDRFHLSKSCLNGYYDIQTSK